MKAYEYDGLPGDQRLPHDSGKDVEVDQLKSIGVLYYHFDDIEQVDGLARERGYKHRDEIFVCPEKMGAVYNEKITTFFNEHLHEDEEIRFILGGCGFFDVRSENDRWIRIFLEKSDLIILPAGIFHRFTIDTSNYVHAMRLFKEEPRWTPLNREPALDANKYRQEYVSQYLNERKMPL